MSLELLVVGAEAPVVGVSRLLVLLPDGLGGTLESCLLLELGHTPPLGEPRLGVPALLGTLRLLARLWLGC